MNAEMALNEIFGSNFQTSLTINGVFCNLFVSQVVDVTFVSVCFSCFSASP